MAKLASAEKKFSQTGLSYRAMQGNIAERERVASPAKHCPVSALEGEMIRLATLTTIAALGIGVQPVAAGDPMADYFGPGGDHPAMVYWCNFADPLCGEPGHQGDAVGLLAPPPGASDLSGRVSAVWALVSIQDDRCHRGPLFLIEPDKRYTLRFKCL